MLGCISIYFSLSKKAGQLLDRQPLSVILEGEKSTYR